MSATVVARRALADLLAVALALAVLAAAYRIGRIDERQARDAVACTFNEDSTMLRTDRNGRPVTPRRVK